MSQVKRTGTLNDSSLLCARRLMRTKEVWDSTEETGQKEGWDVALQVLLNYFKEIEVAYGDIVACTEQILSELVRNRFPTYSELLSYREVVIPEVRKRSATFRRLASFEESKKLYDRFGAEYACRVFEDALTFKPENALEGAVDTAQKLASYSGLIQRLRLEACTYDFV